MTKDLDVAADLDVALDVAADMVMTADMDVAADLDHSFSSRPPLTMRQNIGTWTVLSLLGRHRKCKKI